MITVFGFETTTLADAPAIIERTLKREHQVNDLGVLTLEDKVAIIHRLKDLGFFAMRGSVRFTATLLDLSRTTVYKHINE